jgi:sulfur relay protein TusB/DsrH
MGSRSTDVFLLTKPPQSEKSKLCLDLLARSERSSLYLAGDGVYHLLMISLERPGSCEVRACKEDVAARGIVPRRRAEVLKNFYESLVGDVMERKGNLFTF